MAEPSQSDRLVGRERATFSRTLDLSAKAMAKGQYRNPRDHFVYAEVELTDHQLAEAWQTKPGAVARLRRYDEAVRKLDWVKLREEFWRRLSTRVSTLIEQQTVDEMSDVAEQYRAATSHVIGELRKPELQASLTKLRDSYPDDPTLYLKAVNLLARTIKTVVEIEEKLTGAKVAQQIFDAQAADYDWFVDLIKAFVRDPNALEQIAKAIQQRRVARTLVATSDYAEAIAYARQPARHDIASATRATARLEQAVAPQATESPNPSPDSSDFDL